MVYAGIGKTPWWRSKRDERPHDLDGPARRLGVVDPSVHRGRVFVTSRSGTVYAIDRANRHGGMASATGGLINASSPAVAYGRVYAADLDGDVFAFDEATGAVRWHSNVGAPIVSSPRSQAGWCS